MCHDVTFELLLILGSLLHHLQLIIGTKICIMQELIYIRTKGFWKGESTFFDISTFHPNTMSYCQTQVASLFRRQKLEKKMEILYVMLYVDLLPHLYFLLLVHRAKKLLFFTIAWLIFYLKNMRLPTTRFSLNVLSYPILFTTFCCVKGAETCSLLSTPWYLLNCV